MTKVTCIRDERGNKYSYHVTFNGHANYSEHGKDIVCAGMSVLMMTAINMLADVGEIEKAIVMDKKKGIIETHFIADKDNVEIATIYKYLVIGARAVKSHYPEHIEISIG